MNKLDALLFFPDIRVESGIDTGHNFFSSSKLWFIKTHFGGQCVRINIIYTLSYNMIL